MGKILDAKALTSAIDTRAKHYQELREQMIDLKKALQGVANLGDDFTGKGADNIKSFYKELAGNVDMFISFIDKQKAFHEGVSGTLDDTNFGGDTFVEEHFLDNAVHMGIKNAKSIVKDQKKALKTIFQDIDDLISLEVFDSKTFDEKIADAEDERKKTVKDLIELDQNLKDEYALSETEEKATMALYAEMMNATNDGKSILPMNFDKKAYQNSEIYKAKSDIEKQTSEYLKIKKDQEEARKIAKEQEALANRPWYEKALDYGGNIVNELTGVNDAKRAATGVDPITGEELTAGQRVAAGGMAAAGYIPIVGWAGRIFKGGKAVYKTTQATSAAVRAVDIYKTSQKSFDALKTSQKGLYGLTATNGFSEAITGRDMFGNKVSKEQQEASMNAALGMLLPFGAKGFHGKIGLSSQSPEGFNRKRALRHAKDLGGIPRSQQPTRQWQVGDNVFKKGQEHRNYEYSSNHTHHGRYYEFDTPKGKRVIVQHTNDGKLHTHAGKPKEGADPFNYDFKKERYSNIYGPNGDHHIYYNE
ncbi:T7SS effector LXG polymorphic toxin [Bacillus altitudinis]|nr:T7SS effector LXG polymorphic toxin [Bacillus altitudinis]MEE3606383.1 T7SS effector LXG polymorphic toxin [Bacillus altitudinis]MEE3612519.1 T7SS effector LXG polymorphic toxin [Bacillus altitudinis]MEE3648211.1 T7SS effector LXG polymorphic toxin [Bacillus altitudinis]MEE4392543.1 T7SS effector LXG polymorphic toxin [Bacillus altitudinis]MEE4396268.1 T7SS effector LXG polymorphic toxin [Bacillus altitudinis]